MKGEQRPMSELSVLPDNPRHGDVGAISESLRRFGQQKPIVVNSEGIILAGNHTYRAAVALGWETIWAVESELEGGDQTGFALADNRLSDLATYDHDVLLRQLESLEDIAGTGYDLDDMDELRTEVQGPAIGRDERYTPEWLFDAMGVEFDVDLAAPEGGIDYIPAASYFTEKQNALVQDWKGLTAWCNPPYSIAADFGRKWVSEIEEGVWLGPISHSAQYRVDIMRGARCIYLPEGLEFHYGLELEGIAFPTFMAGWGDLGEEALTNLNAEDSDGILFRTA